MALIEGKGLCFNYGDKELYKNIDIRINQGEHCVLVGANGAGKSTLMEILAGERKPDRGAVTKESHVTISYLDQRLEVKDDQTLENYLYGVYAPLFEKEKQINQLYEKAALGEGDYEALLEKAERLRISLEDAGFYALEEKVGRIVNNFGLNEKLSETLYHLSSGQREKAYLAKMLLEERDVLFMDEPTNFLDANQVNSLATFLNEYKKAFLLISHDEAFLRKVSDVVFSLKGGRLTRYKGGYEKFLEQSVLDEEQYQKDYEAQQRYIKKEEAFIASHIVRATSAKAAKSHRQRLQALDRLEAPPPSEGGVAFSFPFSHHVGEKPLTVENLVIGYDHPLLSPISFTLMKGEKVAVIGHNGVGKSTLIKTLLGEIPALGGKYRFLDGIEIGYYAQDEVVDRRLSPYEIVRRAYPELDKTEIRTLLGRAGIKKELALRPLNELSGGEESKARLSLLMKKRHNFLIFDEPTNHLDQKAKESLYKAIEAFPGSVILVSHEKDFYDGLVDYELTFD